MSEPFDLELAAAGLRADAQDLPALLGGLAAWLEDSVPHLVSVERKRAGLRDSRKLVVRITVRLGDDSYVLEREGGGATARRARTVRGITLKTETLALPDWVAQLGSALMSQAEISEAATQRLRDLLTG